MKQHGGHTLSHTHVFCVRCGKPFVSLEALRNHSVQCEEQEPPPTRGGNPQQREESG